VNRPGLEQHEWDEMVKRFGEERAEALADLAAQMYYMMLHAKHTLSPEDYRTYLEDQIAYVQEWMT
jgi:hypothetical protein